MTSVDESTKKDGGLTYAEVVAGRHQEEPETPPRLKPRAKRNPKVEIMAPVDQGDKDEVGAAVDFQDDQETQDVQLETPPAKAPTLKRKATATNWSDLDLTTSESDGPEDGVISSTDVINLVSPPGSPAPSGEGDTAVAPPPAGELEVEVAAEEPPPEKMVETATEGLDTATIPQEGDDMMPGPILEDDKMPGGVTAQGSGHGEAIEGAIAHHHEQMPELQEDEGEPEMDQKARMLAAKKAALELTNVNRQLFAKVDENKKVKAAAARANQLKRQVGKTVATLKTAQGQLLGTLDLGDLAKVEAKQQRHALKFEDADYLESSREKRKQADMEDFANDWWRTGKVAFDREFRKKKHENIDLGKQLARARSLMLAHENIMD